MKRCRDRVVPPFNNYGDNQEANFGNARDHVLIRR